MRSWLALVLAPAVALGVLAWVSSLAGPSCASGDRVGLHVAAAVGLLVAGVLAAFAAGEWAMHRPEPGSASAQEGDRRARRRYLAILATSVAALSAVVILVLWVSFWVLPPCR